MFTVLLYGSSKDTQTASTLLAAIRSAGCTAMHLTANLLSAVPPNTDKPDFLIVDSFPPPEIQFGRIVLLFKQQNPFPYEQGNIPGDYIAVLDSSNTAAKKILEKSSMQAVTCGMSQKDTVTFSSLEEESAVIWVQRELKRLDGSSIEPQELPVELNNLSSEYPLLAAITVLLLCGISLPQKGFKLL